MRQVVEKKTQDFKIFAKKTFLQVKEGWSWLHCPLLYNLCILNWVFWAFTFEFFPGNFVESDERFYICAQFWIVIPSVIFESALPNPIGREGTVFEGKMLILEIFSFVQCLIWGHQKLIFLQQIFSNMWCETKQARFKKIYSWFQMRHKKWKNIVKDTTDPRDHNTSSYTNLDQISILESLLSINFKISKKKHQHLD